ncbi:hypothetical protein [cyanobacterium endosymbiont of Rhopalodia gibberula]|uniref:hypothetical protein n=1 Tax=cyanobacterium endosymbiont of Rhopalodia gibberula TaxID=1763363 RepID=UPI0011AB5EDF|nr:hypothetical protein [cyanobacterium endosymbiont of Rhopalodia gibberula]
MANFIQTVNHPTLLKTGLNLPLAIHMSHSTFISLGTDIYPFIIFGLILFVSLYCIVVINGSANFFENRVSISSVNPVKVLSK